MWKFLRRAKSPSPDPRSTRRIYMTPTEKRLAVNKRRREKLNDISQQHSILEEHVSNLHYDHEKFRRKISELDYRIGNQLIEEGSDTHKELLKEILDMNKDYNKSHMKLMERVEFIRHLQRQYDLDHRNNDDDDEDFVLVNR